jgi:putative ABC transport system permease protein
VGALHPATVARQARADVWPLVTAAVVICLTTFLAAATPWLLDAMADDAVRYAVADPRAGAEVTVTVPLTEGWSFPRELRTDTASSVEYAADQLEENLPAELLTVLGPPLGAVTSTSLRLGLPDGGPGGSLRLAYVWSADAAEIEWVDGGPGAATATPLEVAGARAGTRWPVEVGLSESAAALLDVGVGESLSVADGQSRPVEVTVTGVFRAQDPQDPVWGQVPELLEPRVLGTTGNARTEVAALLSAESVPLARLAVEPDDTFRTYTLEVEPDQVRHADARLVAARIAALEAAPTDLGIPGPEPVVRSRLDLVLLAADARVQAARAQASVLLVAVVAVSALVLALVAQVLTRRRHAVLAQHRARGASLAAIGGALVLESVTVTALSGGLGLALAAVVAPGSADAPWALPVLAVAVLAAPLRGVRAAWAGTGGRRAPANRRLRHLAGRAARVRRGSAEAALVLVGVGAFVTLRGRGLAETDPLGADLLLAAAPTLLCVAVAVLVVRLLPVGLRRAVAVARGLRQAVPVLSAARAHATSGAAVPFVAVTVAVGLTTFGLVVTETARTGLVDGSWDTVGADVTVRTEASPDLPRQATAVANAQDVDAAVTGRVVDAVQLFSGSADRRVRVVALDAAAFERLLATTPLDDAPQLAGLDEPAADGALPVLLSADLTSSGGDDAGSSDPDELSLLWERTSVPLTPVGAAPVVAAVGGDATDGDPAPLVVVDREALAAALGVDVPPDTLWVAGSGAAAAVADVPALAQEEVTSRTAWIDARRSDPLTSGLVLVVGGAVLSLLGLSVLGVVLGASSSAAARATTLATLRVLGLGSRDVGRVAVGEVMPAVAVAGLTGTVVGALAAAGTVGPLSLRLVTGQAADPALAVPWWAAGPLLALLTTVAVVVAVESSARRRLRLGQVLRVGGP